MNQSIVHSQWSIVKELCLCILAAALLILSFPRNDCWITAWFAFVPLFFVLDKKSKLKRFIFSYFTGVIFWAGTIYWLIHVTLPGTVILILYLALYFGIFGLTYHLPLTTYHFLTIPALWVSLEYARSHLLTGFPWALLGYSQYKNLPIIQISDITGAWGVSFLIMMVNVALYSYFVRPRAHITKRCILIALSLLGVLSYGFYRIHRTPNSEQRTSINISVIQGNIPQELKWEPESAAFIIEKYSQLSKDAGKDGADLIIWPEASSPGVFGEDSLIFEAIFSLAKTIKSPLLLGSVSKEGEEYFNSALLIDSSGRITGRYDKIHLVPFGEYIPLKNIFPFLQTVVPIGDITAGREYTLFNLNEAYVGRPAGRLNRQTKFAVLVCFEDLFPELSREFVKRGADFLVNITNDAWYKKTAAASQHFQASVFRAVENRTFLVRSSNTGVSGFISPTGKIISLIKDKGGKDIFIEGFKTQEIISHEKNPYFYTKYGDVFPCACLLLLLCVMIVPFFKKR